MVALVAFREYLVITSDALLAAATLTPDSKHHLRVRFPSRAFKHSISAALDLIALASVAILTIAPSNLSEATISSSIKAHPEAFAAMLVLPDESSPIVYTSPSYYIGETKNFRRRRWEHILSALRARHRLKAQPLVHNTKVARLQSISLGLAILPIASAPSTPLRRQVKRHCRMTSQHHHYP